MTDKPDDERRGAGRGRAGPRPPRRGEPGGNRQERHGRDRKSEPPFGKNAQRDERRGGERPRFGGKPVAPQSFGEKPRGPWKPRQQRPSADGHERRDDGRERIAKMMARAGVASRRDAEAMIAEGRVSVNGGTIRTPAVLVGPGDRVSIDGQPMPAKERTRLWLHHKPVGLVTTEHDPEGRPTVFDRLPEGLPRVVSIGRLDINTEGLLLLTNDGGLARVLAHPETGWLRRYRVRAFGAVGQADLDKLKAGITLDGMHYGPIEAAIQREQGDNVWLMLGLREGKNREVKHVLDHLGLKVNRLIRVSFGPFQLGDMPPGAVEEVRTSVIKDQLGGELMRKAGVDFNAEAPNARRRSGADRRSEPATHEHRPTKLRKTVFKGSGPSPRSDRNDGRRAAAPRPSPSPGSASPRHPPPQGEREKRRSTWRDAETERARPQGTRKPRRGDDPRAARATSAEREHQRAGRVRDRQGRGVLVERVVGAPKPDEGAPRKPRRRETPRPERTRDTRSGPAPGGAGERPPRAGGKPQDSFGARGPRRFHRPKGPRGPAGPKRGPRRP